MPDHNVPYASASDDPARRSPEIDAFVDHFLALMCDRSRRQIIELLAVPAGEHREHGPIVERRSSDIAKALGLSPATISGHLRQLANARIITSRKEGTEVYYRLENHMLVRAFQELVLALDREHAARYTQELT